MGKFKVDMVLLLFIEWKSKKVKKDGNVVDRQFLFVESKIEHSL